MVSSVDGRHCDPESVNRQSLVVVLRRFSFPAWLLSLVLHLAALFILALSWRTIQPHGAAVEPQRTTGIVIQRLIHDQVEYFEGQAGQELNQADGTESDPALTLAAPLPTEPLAAEPHLNALYSASDQETNDQGPPVTVPNVAGFTQGRPPARHIGSKIQTSVFGNQGTGTRFVYVFDRSASMSDPGGVPLAAAKVELIASLKELESNHQFQIIFYNEEPRPFRPDGKTTRLTWANDRGKALGERFVKGIVAAGATRHIDALKMALRMKPDVIFFLTDAQEPRMTGAELAEIQRLNGTVGASIQSVEFGYGPNAGVHNFLRQLARENGGEHVYVDILQLGRGY